MTSVDDFIRWTQKVIAEDGFGDYLPTLVVEKRKAIHVSVLGDAPDDGDVEPLAKEWALNVTKRKQDYLLAFKVDDGDFKVVARTGGSTTERTVAVEAE